MADEKSKTSYTSANSMPLKLIKDTELLEAINLEKIILPRHIQVAPTNRCNLKCDFCSCDSREKQQELSLDDLTTILTNFHDLGTTAVTTTGGGEPLLHPKINEYIKIVNDIGMKNGLVSNGLLMKNLNPEIMNYLTWARISFGDFRKFDELFKNNMDYLRQNGNKVDLAFSYVVGINPNIPNMVDIMKYANANNFTHVRFVPDLYNVDKINMSELEKILSEQVDTKIAIFQKRSEYSTGTKDCLISLLKPMIAPDGYIYPCCGVQYALPDEGQQRMFPTSMRMGNALNPKEIIEAGKAFDGSKCVKCYYENYNTLLKALMIEYNHKEFI